MVKQVPTKVFLFSYASAAFVILFLAVAAFILTQLSLTQETDALRNEAKYRTLAFTTNTGMLRSQRILRNAIILIAHTPTEQSTQAAKDIATDYPIWQHVHETIVHGDAHVGIVPADFSASEQAQMRGEEADYQAMNTSLAHILAFERMSKHASTQPILADVSTVFYATPRYLKALYLVYLNLNNNADAYSASVTRAVDQEHVLSVLVLATTLLTLLLEAFFIILPANRQMEQMFQRLSTQVSGGGSVA